MFICDLYQLLIIRKNEFKQKRSEGGYSPPRGLFFYPVAIIHFNNF